MKYIVAFLFVFLLLGSAANAQFRRRHKPAWPTTEGEVINKVLSTLRNRDTVMYVSLFPSFDTLWGMVIHNTAKTPEAQQELNKLAEHPQVLIEFDPHYNKRIVSNFAKVLAKGEDSGVQWSSMELARYELYNADPNQSLAGIERIAPERFQGYMFINDAYNRVLYCVRVAEIQRIRDRYFGGQVLNILKAKTVDEFLKREQEERDYMEWLSTHPVEVVTDTATKKDTASGGEGADEEDPLMLVGDPEEEEDEDGMWMRKEVIERRYYEGSLDKEIHIALYVRYIRSLPGKPERFDGLYKLGEKKRYVKLEIKKNADGKWIMEDELGIGVMELKLAGRKYNGFWFNSDDYGYDVDLTQQGTPEGKIEMLDRIIDEGLYGLVDESQFEEDEDGSKKDGDKKDDDKDKKKNKKKKHKKSKKKKHKEPDKKDKDNTKDKE